MALLDRVLEILHQIEMAQRFWGVLAIMEVKRSCFIKE